MHGTSPAPEKKSKRFAEKKPTYERSVNAKSTSDVDKYWMLRGERKTRRGRLWRLWGLGALPMRDGVKEGKTKDMVCRKLCKISFPS